MTTLHHGSPREPGESAVSPVFRGLGGKPVTVSYQYFTMNLHISDELTGK